MDNDTLTDSPDHDDYDDMWSSCSKGLPHFKKVFERFRKNFPKSNPFFSLNEIVMGSENTHRRPSGESLWKAICRQGDIEMMDWVLNHAAARMWRLNPWEETGATLALLAKGNRLASLQ